MRLSVIVPAWNEAEAIRQTLAPLQSWRARGHEVIVVDGGSRDATGRLAAPLADRVITAPRGRARQQNAGAALARGEGLVFLHADTRLPAGGDALIQQALATRHWGRFDVRIAGRHPGLPLVAALMNRRSRLSGISTGDQAIFVRREVFEAVGGFPDQPLMEDIELSRRLKRLGRPACLRPPVVTSGRRWDEYGFWRTVWLMWRLRLAYFLGADPARLVKLYYGPPRGGMASSNEES